MHKAEKKASVVHFTRFSFLFNQSWYFPLSCIFTLFCFWSKIQCTVRSILRSLLPCSPVFFFPGFLLFWFQLIHFLRLWFRGVFLGFSFTVLQSESLSLLDFCLKFCCYFFLRLLSTFLLWVETNLKVWLVLQITVWLQLFLLIVDCCCCCCCCFIICSTCFQ